MPGKRKDLERSAIMMSNIKNPQKMVPLPARELSYKGFDVTKGVNKKDRAKAKELMSAGDLQDYENKTDMSQISNSKNKLPGNTTLSSMSSMRYAVPAGRPSTWKRPLLGFGKIVMLLALNSS